MFIQILIHLFSSLKRMTFSKTAAYEIFPSCFHRRNQRRPCAKQPLKQKDTFSAKQLNPQQILLASIPLSGLGLRGILRMRNRGKISSALNFLILFVSRQKEWEINDYRNQLFVYCSIYRHDSTNYFMNKTLRNFSL